MGGCVEITTARGGPEAAICCLSGGSVAGRVLRCDAEHHGRSESQTVLKGAQGWNAKKKSEEERKRQTTYYFFRKTFREILPAYSHFYFFKSSRTKLAALVWSKSQRLTSGRPTEAEKEPTR